MCPTVVIQKPVNPSGSLQSYPGPLYEYLYRIHKDNPQHGISFAYSIFYLHNFFIAPPHVPLHCNSEAGQALWEVLQQHPELLYKHPHLMHKDNPEQGTSFAYSISHLHDLFYYSTSLTRMLSEFILLLFSYFNYDNFSLFLLLRYFELSIVLMFLFISLSNIFYNQLITTCPRICDFIQRVWDHFI